MVEFTTLKVKFLNTLKNSKQSLENDILPKLIEKS